MDFKEPNLFSAESIPSSPNQLNMNDNMASSQRSNSSILKSELKSVTNKNINTKKILTELVEVTNHSPIKKPTAPGLMP